MLNFPPFIFAIDFIRNKIQGRSVSAIVGLGKLFRMIDSTGDGLLDKQELVQALETFEISLPKKVTDAIYDYLCIMTTVLL